MVKKFKNYLVVVTGASVGGMGETTAYALADMGFYVLAGVLSKNEAKEIKHQNVEPIILDITNSNDIRTLSNRIQRDNKGRKLWALVNNAGIEFNAPFELLKIEEWKKQFDVNLFGQVSLTQEMLPFLRQTKGTIINITSVGGKVALPNYAPYASTKFAFEAASDALRREIKSQGIKVVIVEPGGVRTVMADRSGNLSLNFAKKMDTDGQKLYRKMVEKAVASQTSFLRYAMPASKAGKQIARIVTKSHPKKRYLLGIDAHITVPMNKILPSSWMDFILKK